MLFENIDDKIHTTKLVTSEITLINHTKIGKHKQ